MKALLLLIPRDGHTFSFYTGFTIQIQIQNPVAINTYIFVDGTSKHSWKCAERWTPGNQNVNKPNILTYPWQQQQ